MELTEKQIALYFTDHRALSDHFDLFFLLFSSNQKLCMEPPYPSELYDRSKAESKRT